MEKLIFTNSKGESIEISENYPYILQTIEGLGGVELEIQSQKGYMQDGETYINNTLEPRYITVQFTIVGKNVEDMRGKRARLSSVLNPKLGIGEIKYTYGGVTRIIEVLAEKSPEYASQEGFREYQQKSIVQLYCPNPYWKDITINDIEMVSWIGGLTFPLKLPTQFAMAGEKIINIINNGDVETPVTLEISGKATNPKITNILTGEYIKVISTLQAEDKMIITTGFGNKRVYQNNLNVSNKIDINSTFFSLNVGDNVMQFTTDDINDNANIKISYSNRYVGV